MLDDIWVSEAPIDEIILIVFDVGTLDARVQLTDNFLIILNMEEQNNNGQLQIELKEEVAQGTYANLAIITHSSSEFILDFV